MHFFIKKHTDNQYYGLCALEITGFASDDFYSDELSAQIANRDYFRNLILNFANAASYSMDFSLELLFACEPVQNQSFTSKVRTFFVLRQSADNEGAVRANLELCLKTVTNCLNNAKYNYSYVDKQTDFYIKLMSEFTSEKTVSLIKDEIATSTGLYYWGILNTNSTNNMQNLLSQMSNYKNCAVSFSLFPTKITPNENAYIQYVFEEIGNAKRLSGIIQSEIGNEEKPYRYIISKQSEPMFMYNITVFGDDKASTAVSSELMNLLRSGETENAQCAIKPAVINGNVKLRDYFFSYPWDISNEAVKLSRSPEMFSLVPDALSAIGRLPFVISADEANVFFTPPLYNSNMQYLQKREGAESLVNIPEALSDEKNTICIGRQIGNPNKGYVGNPVKNWARHAVIFGRPGYGKTTFMQGLLTLFAKKEIPFLVIEPTKNEYRSLIRIIPELRVFTPGKDDICPFVFNPFIPPENVPVSTYKQLLISAFVSAFSLTQPLDSIISDAIERTYSKFGWSDDSYAGDKDVEVFGFRDFIKEFRKVMKEDASYGKQGNDTQARIESAGYLRLTKLIRDCPNTYDTIHALPISELLSSPTVIELNAIGNVEQKALTLSFIIAGITAYIDNRETKPGDPPLKNILMLDEAHVLLQQSQAIDTDSAPRCKPMIEIFAGLIAEKRSKGLGVIVADQMPSIITNAIIANCATKISLNLDQSEAELYAKSTGLSEYNTKYLSRLDVGEAFFHVVTIPALDNPILVKTPNIRSKIPAEISDRELAARMNFWKDDSNKKLLIPYNDCCNIYGCKSCNLNIRNKARSFSRRMFDIFRNQFDKNTKVMGFISVNLPKHIKEFGFYNDLSEQNKIKFVNCVSLMIFNEAELRLGFSFTKEEKEKVKNAQKKLIDN